MPYNGNVSGVINIHGTGNAHCGYTLNDLHASIDLLQDHRLFFRRPLAQHKIYLFAPGKIISNTKPQAGVLICTK